MRHSLPGGWFAFLRGIRLREDGKFDEEKTLEVAETADAKIAAASKEQHEADSRVEKMLAADSTLYAEIGKSGCAFVKQHLEVAVRGGATQEKAEREAIDRWGEELKRRRIFKAVASEPNATLLQRPDVLESLKNTCAAKLRQQATEATRVREEKRRQDRLEQARVESDDRRAREFCMSRYYEASAVEPLLKLDYYRVGVLDDCASDSEDEDEDEDEIESSVAGKTQIVDWYFQWYRSKGSEREPQIVAAYDFQPRSFERHRKKMQQRIKQQKSLIGAASTGRLDDLQGLLKQGVHVNAVPRAHDAPALCYAVEEGHVGVMAELVGAGADVDKVGARGRFKGQTPLMRAAYWGKVEVVRWLLDHGADWCKVDGDGHTALGLAVGGRKLEAAAVLRSWVESHGTAAEKEEMVERKRCEALIDAAAAGEVGDARRLLREGANANGMDEGGRLALAAASGRSTGWRRLLLMELLVDAGAEIDKAERFGSRQTALMAAAYAGNVDAVRWLLEHGAGWRKVVMGRKLGPETARAYMTQVGLKAWHDCFDALKKEPVSTEVKLDAAAVVRDWALQHGTAAEKAGLRATEAEWQRQAAERAEEALAAAQKRAAEADGAFWLTEHYYRSVGSLEPDLSMEYGGCDRHECRLADGYSGMRSCGSEEGSMVRYYKLTRGSYLGRLREESAVKQERMLDLISAASKGRLDAVQPLLQQGIDVNAVPTAREAPALCYAAREGHVDVMAELIDAGADVDKPHIRGAMQGWTPLMRAAHLGRVEAVQWLLDHGADWRKTDVDGETALGLALRGAVRGYMERVGLMAWHDYFEEHLPANMKSIRTLRATTSADLRRMATKANMRLDARTSQQVLDALKKEPVSTEVKLDAAAVVRDWALQHGTAAEKAALRATEAEWQRQAAERAEEALAAAQKRAAEADGAFWLTEHYYRSVGSLEPDLSMEYGGCDRHECRLADGYSGMRSCGSEEGSMVRYYKLTRGSYLDWLRAESAKVRKQSHALRLAQQRREREEERRSRAVCLAQFYCSGAEPRVFTAYALHAQQKLLQAAESLADVLPATLEEWHLGLKCAMAKKQQLHLPTPTDDHARIDLQLDIASTLEKLDAAANAQQHNVNLKTIFVRFDHDGDLKLNKTEYAHYLRGIKAWGRREYTKRRFDDEAWKAECAEFSCSVTGITWTGFEAAFAPTGPRAGGWLADLHLDFLTARGFTQQSERARKQHEEQRVALAVDKVVKSHEADVALQELFAQAEAHANVDLVQGDQSAIRNIILAMLEGGRARQPVVKELLAQWSQVQVLLAAEAKRISPEDASQLLAKFVQPSKVLAAMYSGCAGSVEQLAAQTIEDAWQKLQRVGRATSVTNTDEDPNEPQHERDDSGSESESIVAQVRHVDVSAKVNCEYAFVGLHNDLPRFSGPEGHLYFCHELHRWVITDSFDARVEVDSGGLQRYLHSVGLGDWHEPLRKHLGQSERASVGALRALQVDELEEALSDEDVSSLQIAKLEELCKNMPQALELFLLARTSSSDAGDVRSYMKRVGLDAWYDYFDNHLPGNVKSIRTVRSTTSADLRRMATKVNMRLDAKTTKQVLDALKKPPLAAELDTKLPGTELEQKADWSETGDVRAYMKRVGLDAWYDYFDKHLPANMKSIRTVRSTTSADLRRMATKANMRLGAKTTKQVLDALKKPPLAAELETKLSSTKLERKADWSERSANDDDVRAYMKRVGLDAWYDYFDKHLPANMKSIRTVRSTTSADLRRMATKANMRLDAKTTQQVLDVLKKPPLATELEQTAGVVRRADNSLGDIDGAHDAQPSWLECFRSAGVTTAAQARNLDPHDFDWMVQGANRRAVSLEQLQKNQQPAPQEDGAAESGTPAGWISTDEANTMLSRLNQGPSCSPRTRTRLAAAYVALVLAQDTGDQSGVEGPTFVKAADRLGDACMLRYYTKTTPQEVQLFTVYCRVPSAHAWLAETTETVPSGERAAWHVYDRHDQRWVHPCLVTVQLVRQTAQQGATLGEAMTGESIDAWVAQCRAQTEEGIARRHAEAKAAAAERAADAQRTLLQEQCVWDTSSNAQLHDAAAVQAFVLHECGGRWRINSLVEGGAWWGYGMPDRRVDQLPVARALKGRLVFE
eukprot:COSAG02_NODE_1364_length_13033_cov_176.652292_3_plen_2127_part_00